jgi:GNAT superfamily N-acetyltransferase
MRTTVRNATLDDSERIADIYLASRGRYISYAPIVHTDAEVRIWIKTTLVPSGNVLVVSGDEEVMGFLAISRDDTHGWIDHLYLDPSVVGRGLGSLLLEEAKKILGSPIRLYTFQRNEEARRFYRCFASDGNGIQIVIANLVPEPIKRKVPWPREDDDDTSKLLRR